jgi:hypothetical protein
MKPIVAELIPLNAIWIPGKPNPSSRWRWATRGVSGINGERIRLQVWYVANRPFTTEAAVVEFLSRCTEAQELKAARRSTRTADVSPSEMAEVGL